MKINAIRVHNLASMRSAVFEPAEGANAILLCGSNGAGKSTLMEHLRYAFSGEMPNGIKYKKDFSDVITQGEKTGTFQVAYEYEERRMVTTVNLKNGTTSGDTPPDLGQKLFVLSPAQFIGMDPAKRRKVLFDRAGVSLKADDIAEALIKEGNQKKLVDSVIIGLRSGFEQAVKLCKDRASEARGGWQALAGETYGSQKAEGWRPEAPEGAADPEPLRVELRTATNAQVRAVNLRDSLQDADRQHQRAGDLKKTADSLPSLQTDLSLLDNRITESEGKLRDLESVATGRKGWTATCPCCDSTVFVPEGEKVLEKFSAETTGNAKVAAAGAEVERGVLTNLRGERFRLSTRVDTARAAGISLKSLPDRPSQEDLDKAVKEAQLLIESVSNAQTALTNAEAAWKLLCDQQQIADRAATYHLDHQGYNKLAASLEAMPAQFLSEALKRINLLLATASTMCAFSVNVSIGEDMELRYGSIHYGRASESQQWRAQLALGIALGQDTGGLLLMDRFDCVQPQDRGAILVAMGAQNHVQVIIGCMLKSEPMAVPPGVSSHWIGG